MGLKVIADGEFGAGKTGFAVSANEVGPMGAVDTEQRWQWYTTPHPTVKPRIEPPKEMLATLTGGNPAAEQFWRDIYRIAYGLPRQVRQDKTWLPKSEHVIWLVQTMDPILSWNVTRVWALDPEIVTLVKDSASVLWDILQDSKPVKLNEAGEDTLGGLGWTPVKRTDRRSTYTLLKSGKNWILTAHIQDKMNKKMEIIARVPWLEKKNPHWSDIIIRFHNDVDWPAPKAEVVKEKVLGGVEGKLKVGSKAEGLTFKRLLMAAGAELATAAPPLMDTMEQIEEKVSRVVNIVSRSPYNPTSDADPKEGR